MALDNGQQLAFEGAQGFGAYTQGGRGGEIVKVTNLNDSGEGSLRWALEVLDHPRIVVFDVGGTINLRDEIKINGDVTVAGQTAPGGITVTGARLRVVESEVIIRGMHVRPGDDPDGDNPDNRDGISVGFNDREITNVIIDSNSITWSVDEVLTTWGNNSNITFSNNIVGEALRDSIHSKGEHSMGLLVGNGSSQVSIIGNLLTSNNFRNALVKDGSYEVEFINNVVHNYGNKGFTARGESTAHVINNVFIAGMDSTSNAPIGLESTTGNAAYYIVNNIGETSGSGAQTTPVFTAATTEYMKTGDVLDYVLKNVGATAGGRDAIDARIIDGVINGTGRIIDSEDDVGGHLHLPKQTGLQDSDDDGIPDAFEVKIGSNVKIADAHGDADGDGQSNIETYINGLLDGFTAPTQQQGPVQAPAPAPTEPQQGPVQAPPTSEQTPHPAPAPVIDEKVVVEAEDMILNSGFQVRKIGPASGDHVIAATSADLHEAEMSFNGSKGIYDLEVRYFDESDGESQLTVLVNGKAVADWTWDADLGSVNASGTTLTSKVISGLTLNPGDEVKLVGTADGREPLRVDKLTFDKVGMIADETTVPEGSTSVAAKRVEAEDFDLTGFRLADLKAAGNGIVIQRDGRAEHRADLTFDGKSGVYDISIEYFDENDGESTLTLAINGKAIDKWQWDQDLGRHLANHLTATQHVIEGVRINAGDVVSMIGIDDGSEPIRIDAIEFQPDDLSF